MKFYTRLHTILSKKYCLYSPPPGPRSSHFNITFHQSTRHCTSEYHIHHTHRRHNLTSNSFNITCHQATQHSTSECHNLHTHRRHNLISHTLKLFSHLHLNLTTSLFSSNLWTTILHFPYIPCILYVPPSYLAMFDP